MSVSRVCSYTRQRSGVQCYVALILFALLTSLIYNGNVKLPIYSTREFKVLTYEPKSNDPNKFMNSETNKRYPDEIVPNIIHYLRLGKTEFSALEATCVLSAFHNHKPSKLIFHTDQKLFSGVHWENLLNTPGFSDIYEIQSRSKLKDIFGQDFVIKEHANHLVRLQILKDWGGIFLSNDAFVIRSLKDFLHYEMTLASDSNLLIIADRDARLLDRWLQSYKQYEPHGSHRNGEIPPLLMYDELAVVLPLNVSGTVTLFQPTSEEFRQRFVVKLHESKERREKDKMIEQIIQSVYPEAFLLQI